jgi:rubrerythrin
MRSFVGYIETTGNNSGFVNKRERQKQMYFLICESCFWCASTSNLYFIKDEAIGKCPLCDDDRLSVIPILRG